MATLIELRGKASALEARLDKTNAAYAEQRAAIPHVTVKVGNHGRVFSTENEWDVRHARSAQQRLGYLEDLPGNYDEYRAYHDLIKADDERRDRLATLDKRLGWTAINDRYDALLDRAGKVETTLLNMPAPDGAALMWKVERLYAPGDGIWSEGVEDQTHADLRRFLLSGRA